jgi:hypothetical protein
MLRHVERNRVIRINFREAAGALMSFHRLFYKVPLWFSSLFKQIFGPAKLPPVPCDCSSCGPASDHICSYSGTDTVVTDAYVANAYRGSLFLTPGNGAGVIGGLLHALTPPQHYSHMGIFVANYNLIRHCTCSSERLSAPEYFTGSILGSAAPTDGLNIDHLEHGWPGTITQSVYQAVIADRYKEGPLPDGSKYEGSMLADPQSTQGKKYLMNDLSFDSISDDGQTWYPPLIVKPCPKLQTPAISDAMDAIVAAALSIYAHYRFFAYTNGLIGGLSDYSGPDLKVPNAMPDFNVATGRWSDWADAVKPSSSESTPITTIPGVCSSFVWQAIQNAFPKNALKTVLLDWAKSTSDALGEANGACIRAQAPDWTADNLDPYTVNGLYFYSEESRKSAGQTLYDNLSKQIFESLKKTLHDNGGVEKAVAGAIDDIGRGAFVAAAEGGVATLAPVLLEALPALVLDAVFLEQLIELLYDIPDDIANQVCNAFAFDCYRGFPGDTGCVDGAGTPITDVDSSNWSSAPGPGRAVSPDNIHMFWDAPGPWDAKTARGLYGYNAPAQLCVGAFSRPQCVVVPKTGMATISGFVTYNKRILTGAYVSAQCATTITPGPNTPYRLQVGSGGRYKVVARYEDPTTGLTLYGEGLTGAMTSPPLQPGADVTVDIAVIPPPDCMRNVIVQGIIRCDDVYLTGSDNDQQSFQKTLFVQSGVAKFNIDTGAWTVDASDPKVQLADHNSASFAVGDSQGVLNMTATIDSASNDQTVHVTLQGVLNPSDDNLSTDLIKFDVAAGATFTVTDNELDTGGPFNDRAYFRGITVVNRATTAI